MPALVELLAARHLGGPLPDDVVDLMRPLDAARDEVHACLRRAFRWMEQARYRPEDFSLGLAAFFAVQMPNVLPGMWGGAVPPITTAGRHTRLDDFLAANPYRPHRPGDRLLDVGCGFPPLTSVDTAARFPDVEVTAIDPAFGEYLVYDDREDYACLDATGDVRFVTGAAITPERRAALYRDMDATRARFTALRDALLPLLPPGDALAEASNARGRIVRRPVAGYERPNLRFLEVGIGAEGLPSVDVIRCMNLLFYYPRDFYDVTRAWAARLLRPGGLLISGYNAPFGENSMYFVWRRDPEALTPVEFAFDATLLRSLSPAFFGYCDDEEERALLCPVLAAVAEDTAFRAKLDAAYDAALAATGLASRRPDGFLGGLPSGSDPAWVRAAWRDLEARLRDGGWPERAAEALTRVTGRRAWRNAVGHLAVDPLEWGCRPLDSNGTIH
ncbi:MAG: hypothetical protein AB7I38_04730 [Dehalococcoidia bacterium]